MNTIVDKAVVLRRTNYGEADRIVSFLTENNGKITCLAKGVRKQKSKMAGGIEPYCQVEITFIKGRGGMSTLTSSKIISHYGNFMTNYARLELAQNIIRTIDRQTEESSESEYFILAVNALEQVNTNIDDKVLELWWLEKYLDTAGSGLNVSSQTNGQKLLEDKQYLFDLDGGGFFAHPEGVFSPNHIKFLKLACYNTPDKLVKVNEASKLSEDLLPSIRSFIKLHTH